MESLKEIMRHKQERTVQPYTKIPVTIEAIRNDGTRECVHRMQRWMRENGQASVCVKDHEDGSYFLSIRVSVDENIATIKAGAWLLRGVEGEFYPCQDSIFRKTYASA